MTARRRALAAAAGLLVLATSACAAETVEGAAVPKTCALALLYEGRTYTALVARDPVPGTGDLAKVPYSQCEGERGAVGAQERPDGPSRYQAQTIEGVSPDVAFVVPSRWPGYVFYSGRVDDTTFPDNVARLLVDG